MQFFRIFNTTTTMLLFILLVVSISPLLADEEVQALQRMGLRTDEEVIASFSSDNYTMLGDMMVPNNPPSTRAGFDLWPNWPQNTVPYVISENVTADLRPVIPEAIKYLQHYTCTKFREKNKSDEHFIRFMMDPFLVQNPKSQMACSAMRGYQMVPDQFVKMGPKCHKMSLVHELIHTLGFSHEHQRNDRDEYIEVHTENMIPEGPPAYLKDADDCRRIFGGKDDPRCKFSYHNVAYNYDSIMHYCDTCPSANGLPVYINLRNKNALGKPENTGQSFGLSLGDWYLVNRKYGCDPDRNPQIPKPPPIPDNPPKDDAYKKPVGCKRRAKK